MVYLPMKAGTDLSHLLGCYDTAVLKQYSILPEGNPQYSWFSVVVMPHDSASKHLTEKYGKELECGLVELVIVTSFPQPSLLNEYFPCLSALAGYRSSSVIPKGWVSYKDNCLVICSGESSKRDFDPPKGLAFDGDSQFTPGSKTNLLFKKNWTLASLHEMFCLTESLLRTLY